VSPRETYDLGSRTHAALAVRPRLAGGRPSISSGPTTKTPSSPSSPLSHPPSVMLAWCSTPQRGMTLIPYLHRRAPVSTLPSSSQRSSPPHRLSKSPSSLRPKPYRCQAPPRPVSQRRDHRPARVPRDRVKRRPRCFRRSSAPLPPRPPRSIRSCSASRRRGTAAARALASSPPEPRRRSGSSSSSWQTREPYLPKISSTARPTPTRSGPCTRPTPTASSACRPISISSSTRPVPSSSGTIEVCLFLWPLLSQRLIQA
jgi:hypothetical protein